MTDDYYAGSFKDGEFKRPPSGFREWVRRGDPSGRVPEAGRYHLYVSLACPWSHRALILREALGLESTIGVSITHPIWNEKGWHFGAFPGATPDEVNCADAVIDLYRKTAPDFQGEETVPVLWDRREGRILSNESRDIMRMMTEEFREFHRGGADFCPRELASEIDRTIDALYAPINNGVYQCGFARTQGAYERAAKRLFEQLDRWERELATRRYLCGDRITEADVAFYVTLIRFDSVYVSHFKCSIRRIVDYPNLQAYLRDLYSQKGFGSTTDFTHIKQHYFGSHKDLNPRGLIPLGPEIDWTLAHGRERLSSR